jgi:hypothetical protein
MPFPIVRHTRLKASLYPLQGSLKFALKSDCRMTGLVATFEFVMILNNSNETFLSD